MYTNTTLLRRTALVVAATFSSAAFADPYNFEVDLNWAFSQTDTRSSVAIPGPAVLVNTSRSDNDRLGIRGSWFLSAVDTNEGALQRAAFIDRASSLTFSYLRGDGTQKITISDPASALPPTILQSEQRSDDYSADFNYVWKDSGWWIGAGISRFDFELNTEAISLDLSGNRYLIGTGKYIGKMTSIGVQVLQLETDDDDTTAMSINFTHVGNLGQSWQYSTDISLSDEFEGDSDGGFFGGLTLHPTRALAFGMTLSGPLQNTSDGTIGYGIMASWFPTENVGLWADYNWSDINEPPNTDIEADGFGASVIVRF